MSLALNLCHPLANELRKMIELNHIFILDLRYFMSAMSNISAHTHGTHVPNYYQPLIHH